LVQNGQPGERGGRRLGDCARDAARGQELGGFQAVRGGGGRRVIVVWVAVVWVVVAVVVAVVAAAVAAAVAAVAVSQQLGLDGAASVADGGRCGAPTRCPPPARPLRQAAAYAAYAGRQGAYPPPHSRRQQAARPRGRVAEGRAKNAGGAAGWPCLGVRAVPPAVRVVVVPAVRRPLHRPLQVVPKIIGRRRDLRVLQVGGPPHLNAPKTKKRRARAARRK
jgi:hypothetical protein